MVAKPFTDTGHPPVGRAPGGIADEPGSGPNRRKLPTQDIARAEQRSPMGMESMTNQLLLSR